MTSNRITSPHDTWRPTRSFISPCNQINSRQKKSQHHHHGTAEVHSQKKSRCWHRAGWLPCAHCSCNFWGVCWCFRFETSAPGFPGSTLLYMYNEQLLSGAAGIGMTLPGACPVKRLCTTDLRGEKGAEEKNSCGISGLKISQTNQTRMHWSLWKPS